MKVQGKTFNSFHGENIIMLEDLENEEFYFFEFWFGCTHELWGVGKDFCHDEKQARFAAETEYAMALSRMNAGLQWLA